MHAPPASTHRSIRAGLWLALWLLLATQPVSASVRPEAIDPELKQRLVAAMADRDGFLDRYEAEVWLVDMAQRLKKRMPDQEKRLSFLRLVHYEASKARLHPELVLAVIQVESNFDRFAISNAGAQGLMQVMPFWLDEIGLPGDNLFNIQTNLRMGCTILRYYLDMEKENTTRALARYNGSLGSPRYPRKVYEALRTRWYKH